ncbi:MAG: hypothetical protein UY33_C0002G0045 [Candidatus Amesbacteria bacterium GW2011_GWA1_48_9]|uniref:Uncharacterized protein n=1 Tax=Candidatus Amesbacteria bacterium GW2011_GWA1_48_9 TaxID=1618355 RepID=A0A0G1V3X2_9BACT|nr:MAG: hypothetical protein UY33_C0002G0045 [Candidatus Amesbacteria bacterium GW2011_GWA1_48_9]
MQKGEFTSCAEEIYTLKFGISSKGLDFFAYGNICPL